MKIFILFLATLVSAFGSQQGVLYDSSTKNSTPTTVNYRAANIRYTGAVVSDPLTLSGTTINWSTGTTFKRTMAATETYTFTGAVDGQNIVVYVNNPSNFSANWPTTTWDGATTPTQSSNAIDTYVFSYVGGVYYGSFLPGTIRKIDLSNTSQITGILDSGSFPPLSGDVITASGSTVTSLIPTGTPGTYRSVTTDSAGRITAGTTPTTFPDYAISDTSAHFLAAITDPTGSGLVMGNNTPTIVTPTIASFVNATHNHQNAAGGGTLAGAAITGAIGLHMAVQSLTDGATVTITCNSTNVSENQVVTLGGNRNLAITGATSGTTGVLFVNQDSVGSRSLTLPANSKVINGGGGVVTLTTTPLATDVLTWFYNGTNFYWNKGLFYN